MEYPNEPQFENVDVHVRSPQDLSALAAALQKKVHVLHSGRVGRMFHLRFQLRGMSPSPAVGARRIGRLVDRLPPPARRLWDDARTRELDFGFSSGLSQTKEWVLPPDSVALAVGMNAQIRITVYPAE